MNAQEAWEASRRGEEVEMYHPAELWVRPTWGMPFDWYMVKEFRIKPKKTEAEKFLEKHHVGTVLINANGRKVEVLGLGKQDDVFKGRFIDDDTISNTFYCNHPWKKVSESKLMNPIDLAGKWVKIVDNDRAWYLVCGVDETEVWYGCIRRTVKQLNEGDLAKGWSDKPGGVLRDFYGDVIEEQA